MTPEIRQRLNAVMVSLASLTNTALVLAEQIEKQRRELAKLEADAGVRK